MEGARLPCRELLPTNGAGGLEGQIELAVTVWSEMHVSLRIRGVTSLKEINPKLHWLSVLASRSLLVIFFCWLQVDACGSSSGCSWRVSSD